MALLHLIRHEENIDGNHQHAQQHRHDLVRHPVHILAHDRHARRERNRRNHGERQLQRHNGVQQIVHARQILDAAEERHTERGQNRDHSREQHSLPAGPRQIEEALHGELAGIGAGHRGALAGRQDADRPNVHGRRSECAAQKQTALVQVGVDQLRGIAEGVHSVLVHRSVLARFDDILVRFAVQTVGEHRHDEHVDHERNEEGNGRFDEVVQIGFTHFPVVTTIHITRLARESHKRKMLC